MAKAAKKTRKKKGELPQASALKKQAAGRVVKAVLSGSLLLFVIAAAAYFHWRTPFLKTPAAPSATAAPDTGGGPAFTRQGSLVFLDKKGKKKADIEIEIADTPEKRVRGLMDRPFLPENGGMLFIFDHAEPIAFWMKNTRISLDIIYADRNRSVISIHPHTRPFSEMLLPSSGKALYVVEVNAGFCDRFGITAGDIIRFQRSR